MATVSPVIGQTFKTWWSLIVLIDCQFITVRDSHLIHAPGSFAESLAFVQSVRSSNAMSAQFFLDHVEGVSGVQTQWNCHQVRNLHSDLHLATARLGRGHMIITVIRFQQAQSWDCSFLVRIALARLALVMFALVHDLDRPAAVRLALAPALAFDMRNCDRIIGLHIILAQWLTGVHWLSFVTQAVPTLPSKLLLDHVNFVRWLYFKLFWLFTRGLHENEHGC
mmetsp:Transcript_78531/g.139295  ORF Transcript_78531/g.139295 Transcript_78531/m.139295 type:complete len:223 (+) Transcript_78531:652-1320(+)